MERFFQTCSSIDEEEIIDLLLHRYGNLEYIMQSDIETAERIIAKEENAEKVASMSVFASVIKTAISYNSPLVIWW